MTLRGVGFTLACALLYGGPLLAGMMRADWRVLPVFALIFLLWTLVMRPALLAPAPPMAQVTRLIMTFAVQFALVSACWGLGLALALVIDLPTLSLAWPLALSTLAVPASRATRQPMTPAMEDFLTEATETLEKMAGQLQAMADAPPVPPDLTPREDTEIAAALRALNALPPQQISIARIDKITAGPRQPHAADALVHAIRAHPAPQPALMLADLILSLRPDVIEANNYQGQVLPLLRLIDTRDPALITMATQVVLRMYDALGTRAVHVDLPDTGTLLARAAEMAQNGNEAAAHDLRALYKASAATQDAYMREMGQDHDD